LTIEIGLIAIALLLAGLVGAFLVLKMRRAGLALHRQIDGLRVEIQAARSDTSAGFAAHQEQRCPGWTRNPHDLENG
jgi:hypothetical protein